MSDDIRLSGHSFIKEIRKRLDVGKETLFLFAMDTKYRIVRLQEHKYTIYCSRPPCVDRAILTEPMSAENIWVAMIIHRNLHERESSIGFAEFTDKGYTMIEDGKATYRRYSKEEKEFIDSLNEDRTNTE